MRYIGITYTIRSGDHEFLGTTIIEIAPRQHEQACIKRYFTHFYPEGRYDEHDKCYYYDGDTVALEIEHWTECSSLERQVLNRFSVY